MVNLAFHSMALWEYYINKHRWTSKIINLIWWPIYYQSLSKLLDSDKLCIMKITNNRWPMLHREQKYNRKETNSSNKQYRLYTKMEDHIIRCRVQSRQKIRNKWQKEFTTFLSKSHTPKAICDAICYVDSIHGSSQVMIHKTFLLYHIIN
jgi:hypothetical protein